MAVLSLVGAMLVGCGGTQGEDGINYLSDEPVRDLDSLSNLYEKECASDERVVMLFTGDIGQAEGTPISNRLDAVGGDTSQCLTNGLIDKLNSADILVVNNEFTYSTRGESQPGKTYTFRADPSRVHILNDMGADLVSLANNHVFDYGEEAFFDTMDTISEAGLPYIGAGADIDEAAAPVYFYANDKVIAVCAASQIERSSNQTQYATEERCGINKCLDDTRFCEEIAEADENADYVVVYVHWGIELAEYPEEYERELAKEYIAAGADLVIGSHPHVLQGIEYIDGVPVVYSMGNFIFHDSISRTMALEATFSSDGVSLRCIPAAASGSQTYVVDDGSEILSYLESISYDVSIEEDGTVREN